MSDFEDFQLACGYLLIAMGKKLNRFVLKIGEYIVKVMDWMNE